MALLYKFFDNGADPFSEARVLLLRSIREKVECKRILVSFSITLCQFLFKMPSKNGLSPHSHLNSLDHKKRRRGIYRLHYPSSAAVKPVALVLLEKRISPQLEHVKNH